MVDFMNLAAKQFLFFTFQVQLTCNNKTFHNNQFIVSQNKLLHTFILDLYLQNSFSPNAFPYTLGAESGDPTFVGHSKVDIRGSQ